MNLNQVTIPSVDVDKSVLFYQKLGLKIIVDSAPRYVRFQCPDGTSSFSIHRVDKVAEGEGIIVYFECENLDEEYRRLRSENISFDHGPIDQEWLWREARLTDPDGNQIILYFAGINRLDPPWKVK